MHVVMEIFCSFVGVLIASACVEETGTTFCYPPGELKSVIPCIHRFLIHEIVLVLRYEIN